MQEEHTFIERTIVKWLSVLFDVVVITLGTLTMAYVIYMIWRLIADSIVSFNVENILHQVVLIIIFLEIFEMLTIYIKEHHVSMRNIVELGVLAMIRKLIISADYNQFTWQMLIAVAVLIFVMGWIYVQERRTHIMMEDEGRKKLNRASIKNVTSDGDGGSDRGNSPKEGNRA